HVPRLLLPDRGLPLQEFQEFPRCTQSACPSREGMPRTDAIGPHQHFPAFRVTESLVPRQGPLVLNPSLLHGYLVVDLRQRKRSDVNRAPDLVARHEFGVQDQFRLTRFSASLVVGVDVLSDCMVPCRHVDVSRTATLRTRSQIREEDWRDRDALFYHLRTKNLPPPR